MSLRDDIERILRGWNNLEIDRGAPPIVDFDCYPFEGDTPSLVSRFSVLQLLEDSRNIGMQQGETRLVQQIDAHLAFLRALLGERLPLDDYILATQGCRALGWSEEYVTKCGEVAQKRLEDAGIAWGPATEAELEASEGALAIADVPEAIRQATVTLESFVRDATGTDAPYELTITTTDVDEYWSYWLDGSGHRIRLRLNLRKSGFTEVRARQFALHEVLGHGLQSASMAQHCAREAVPWIRLLCVHAPQQILLEGLAQALPLFITPDDDKLMTRVRLDHYLQLVRAELHIALNQGASVEACVRHARARVPFWTEAAVCDALTDRGVNALLRSYLWSYPAGLDWFVALADADAKVVAEVLHAAYRAPLTPYDLTALWPDGPPIGGPGGVVRLR